MGEREKTRWEYRRHEQDRALVCPVLLRKGYPVQFPAEGPRSSWDGREMPVVIVGVPIGVTCEVIRKVGPLADSLLMDWPL
jgi:hypothetical protein